MTSLIYKIATAQQWHEAERNGTFGGAPVDLQDGFIHFSDADQLRETAGKHFSGETGLVLVEVDAGALGEALKYEVSRGGKLFPHLYARLPLSAVRRTWPLTVDESGKHVFPPEIGA